MELDLMLEGARREVAAMRKEITRLLERLGRRAIRMGASPAVHAMYRDELQTYLREYAKLLKVPQ
ncbi:hypothetical protein PQQ72_06815 [Paraburkholderia strydomiana]|uniref:hypothetical protein n=1 Tax=Paraburkholderia TaxID=1822464 RepID=UPI0038B721B8